mmetsp:Transcript_2614/g.7407  ORF Transcript_2614/g.7407 Transcript_2614/m.7407 type:complete len:229 (+) Transcript_2614:278-964(+)|eukprot:CAMPEP_0117661232 /NCGR_PEP_ID=MMETSP0804-20121206/7429_1 /TAXON_ID=1074897 /ORGANISM="Tetraselmis astigmatica, Strain CCMP880" /LENGTH=228 /DNA_ID=CAMNT_0005468089 /DNA_START=219 /DNA_END=905 /DNA_ORIENTATION=+
MKESLEFDPAFSMLTVKLDEGESVIVESGCMIACSGVTMDTRYGGKGLFESLGRMFGGENFFLNEFTGGPKGGWISMGPGCPGDIKRLELEPGRELFIQVGCFLASTVNVKTDTKWQGFKGMLSGNGFFFLRATIEDAAAGKVWYNSYGGIKEIALDGETEVMVDTGHLVAFEDSVQYVVTKLAGMKSLIFGGEGLVMKLSGKGRVWIQTRELRDLAMMLQPFISVKD